MFNVERIVTRHVHLVNSVQPEDGEELSINLNRQYKSLTDTLNACFFTVEICKTAEIKAKERKFTFLYSAEMFFTTDIKDKHEIEKLATQNLLPVLRANIAAVSGVTGPKAFIVPPLEAFENGK